MVSREWGLRIADLYNLQSRFRVQVLNGLINPQSAIRNPQSPFPVPSRVSEMESMTPSIYYATPIRRLHSLLFLRLRPLHKRLAKRQRQKHQYPRRGQRDRPEWDIQVLKIVE